MTQLWNGVERPIVRFAAGTSVDLDSIREARFPTQQTVDVSHQHGNR